MSRNDVKKVTVSLTGIHETGGDEELSNVCEGTLIYREPYYFVTYEEKLDNDSDELTKTLLRYNEESLKVTRKGNAKSELVFIKGETYKGKYETAMGTFDVEIITDDFECEIEASMAEIKAETEAAAPAETKAETEAAAPAETKAEEKAPAKAKIEVSYRLGLNGMRPSESHMSIQIS